MDNMTQGERVKLIRTTLDLTLEKFGNKIGMKKNSISQIENGKNSLTDQTMMSIVREFHVSFSWLANGDGEMFSKNDTAIKGKVDQIMSGENDFHKRLIESIIDLDDDTLIMLQKLVDKLANKKAD